MTFYIDKSINNNSIILHDDYSFGYKELIEPWNYQIELDDSAQFLLNIDSKINKCTSCEGFVIQTKKVELRNLEIPKWKIGGLFVKDYVKESEFVSGFKNHKTLTYDMKNKNLYFDKKNKIFAIGEISSNNFYKFGKGQYVSLSDDGNLNCVLICFDN